jgi:hypothetical protein
MRVAVEETLSDVKQALRGAGFEVTSLSTGEMTDVDIAVVAGRSDDALGYQNVKQDYPIIDRRGMTAEEVVAVIRAHADQR